MNRRRALKTISWVAAIAATALIHRQIPSELRIAQGDAFVPRPEFAKAVSLGFDSVLADYYWVQAVLLAGGGTRPSEVADQLGRMIDVVTTLDPWVDHPYRFAAVWLSNSYEQVMLGNRLLRRSFDYHPDDWRNRFYLGFNLFYFLEENEKAAEVLFQASQRPGAPAYLSRLVARLRSEHADIEAAALFLQELVRTAPDEDSKANFQAALDEIEVEYAARALDRARAAYWELEGRDIERVEDLLAGEHPVLAALPSAEPSSLPAPMRRGSVWEIDEETKRIVSSYYGRRYELHVSELARQDRAKIASGASAKRGGEGAASDSRIERGSHE